MDQTNSTQPQGLQVQDHEHGDDEHTTVEGDQKAAHPNGNIAAVPDRKQAVPSGAHPTTDTFHRSDDQVVSLDVADRAVAVNEEPDAKCSQIGIQGEDLLPTNRSETTVLHRNTNHQAGTQPPADVSKAKDDDDSFSALGAVERTVTRNKNSFSRRKTLSGQNKNSLRRKTRSGRPSQTMSQLTVMRQDDQVVSLGAIEGAVAGNEQQDQLQMSIQPRDFQSTNSTATTALQGNQNHQAGTLSSTDVSKRQDVWGESVPDENTVLRQPTWTADILINFILFVINTGLVYISSICNLIRGYRSERGASNTGPQESPSSYQAEGPREPSQHTDGLRGVPPASENPGLGAQIEERYLNFGTAEPTASLNPDDNHDEELCMRSRSRSYEGSFICLYQPSPMPGPFVDLRNGRRLEEDVHNPAEYKPALSPKLKKKIAKGKTEHQNDIRCVFNHLHNQGNDNQGAEGTGEEHDQKSEPKHRKDENNTSKD